MTIDELNKLVFDAANRRAQIRESKGKEYTQGNLDVLANFRRVGLEIQPLMREGASIEQAALVGWAVFFSKHYDALRSYIKYGTESSSEGIEGRIDDMQVYLDLCRGLVAELKTSKKETVQCNLPL